MNKGYITDVFWDRIYLNFTIEIERPKIENIYLFLDEKLFEAIKVKKISDCKYQATINITNIKNKKMLKDGSYSIRFFDGDKYQELFITTELGYKLENLDKIYQYKEYYAYTVRFEVKNAKTEGELSCILKSRFMVAKYIPFKIKIKGKFIKCIKNIFNLIFKLFNILHQIKKTEFC